MSDAPMTPHLLREAMGMFRRNELDAARAHWMRVLAEAPEQPEALRLLGCAHLRQGRPAEAIVLLRRALAARSDMVEAWRDLARALSAAGLPGQAGGAWQEVLRRQPDDAEAARAFAALLPAAPPAPPAALFHAAARAHAANRLDEALTLFRQAAARLDDPVPALVNAAAVLLDQGRAAEALATLEAAPEAGHPAAATLWRHRAAALGLIDRPREAIAACRRSLRLEPGNADALFALACNRLLLGDFAQGWVGYEQRWRLAGAQQEGAASQAPLWLGQVSLAGRTLLLRAEQGFGDIIQFARYAPLLRGRAARLVLAVPAPLLRLMQGLADEVVDHDRTLPPHDFQVPLMSLPLALGTSLATIPGETPYLRADPALRAAWRERLGKRRGLRIGVAWTGDPRTPRGMLRRVPPEALLPALLATGAELHVLQKEIADPLPEGVHTHAAALTDFAETAALVAEMDVVVSSCTSVAHLAGALARPLLLMLQQAADFRWLRHRADSPWYPTATLFRQTAAGEWGGVIGAVAEEVKGRAAFL